MRPHFIPLALAILSAISLSGCVVSAAPTSVTELPAVAVTSPVTNTLPSQVTPTRNPTVAPPSTLYGPLTDAQRAALTAAAAKYIAPTEADAIKVARLLGFIGDNAMPQTVCGPLSIRILQDSGLLDPAVPLLDFYYLNPRPGEDQWRLEKVFPRDSYEWIILPEPINKIDYQQHPLYPGDFVYLFAGDSGSFEHMLVVTRVDDEGRAYSVTNINSAAGVVIQDVMLYDPSESGKGQFYTWTDWEMRTIGRTGFGGMWIWRHKSDS
jgi:hypothetical protein